MRILLATDDEQFLPALAEAYQAAGCEVVAGVANLALRAARFDIIHLQWPEALVGWRTPTDSRLARLLDDLAWWRERAMIVGTVHNLFPHGRHDSPMDQALFAGIYQACDLITHFSAYSHGEFVRMHPALAGSRHLVHRPFLYTDLLPLSLGREAARARIGAGSGEFVIAALGKLREQGEFDLLQAGVRAARVRGKRPMLAARFEGGRPGIAGRALSVLSRGRLGPKPAGIVPRQDMVALMEAADVFVISRYPPHLNSGVLHLAMTFGTPMVVPDYGIYAEYLRDAGCAFYPPRDAKGLAAAIERIAAEDREELVRRNRDVARDWGWPGAVTGILAAADPHHRPTVGRR